MNLLKSDASDEPGNDLDIKTETFECEDSYEAKKLAGLLGVHKDESFYVLGISGAVKNEIIIMLKDKSSHSVILKDEKNVSRLKSLIEEIACGSKKVSECLCKDYSSQVQISAE